MSGREIGRTTRPENRFGTSLAMENSLLVALSRQMVMQRHMDVIANNIANAQTPGYKGEQLMFVEYLAPTETGETVSYVQDLALARDFSEGDMTQTGNPLDLAIHGEGWFVIDRPDGVAYTRNGHFTLNERGQITTTGGYPVLGTDGTPITLTVEDRDVEISADGTVSTPLGRKGRLDIVKFPEGAELTKDGETLFKTSAAPEPATAAKVVQGMVEHSNVRPVVEVTNMIWALRSYQSATEVTKGEDGLLREAIDTLTDTRA